MSVAGELQAAAGQPRSGNLAEVLLDPYLPQVSTAPSPDLATSPSAPSRGNSDRLSGSVERVTFHNVENGFCVLRVKVRGHRDLVTVVGHAAAISAGEHIEADGLWLNDRTHG